MRIGLIAVDGRNSFPNLALMRLSNWHKQRGDTVEWWTGFTHYDRVYMSKVFTFTPDFDTVINAEEIITGGTGYKNFGSLPPEVEACPPDYTLYPNWKPAVGFLTRGCCRCCDFCIVPRKEGAVHPATAYLKEAGVSQSRFWAYALVRDVEEAHRRVMALREMGVEPFAQPYRDYDGGEPTEEQKAFARWVNRKSLFKSCTWESYKK